jgi:hypothetical protein
MLRRARDVLGYARHANLFGDISACKTFLSTSAGLRGKAPPDNGWLPPEATFYGHQHQWHDKYCRQRNVMPIGPRFPALASNVYIAPSAVVAGDVDIMDGVCNDF